MTYERVVVSIKSTGPDPTVHIPVEVAWWDLTSGERGVFVPAHHVNATLGSCDLDTIEAIGYVERLARAAQDTDGHEVARLAKALHKAWLVSDAPMMDSPLIRRMIEHYLNDVPDLTCEMWQPDWLDVLDVRSYAAGILGLDVLPDLEQVCQIVGVPLEAARTAETDVDAIGRCVLRLTELSADAGRQRRDLVAAPSLAELGAALAEEINASAFDLVVFGQDERTYSIEGGQIAAIAVERFRPVYASLAAEAAQATQQLHEVAQASQNAGDAWRAEIDTLTVQVEQARAAKVSDAELQGWCDIVNAHQAFESADSAHYTTLLNYTTAARHVAGAVVQRDSELDRLDKAWHSQADELQATRDRLAQLVATRWQETVLDTPWEQLVVVPSIEPGDGVYPAELAPEFEVGKQASSTEPAADAEADSPGDDVRHDLMAGLARLVSPVKGGCPNLPGCEHPGFGHDIEDHDDPIPLCVADGCPCGRAPYGWRRVSGQRVFQQGDTVPAGMHVFARDGAVYGLGLTGEWVNESLGPVVEVQPVNAPIEPPASPTSVEVTRG